MYWIHVIIVSLFLQTFFITGINGNVIRQRRQQPPQQQQQLQTGSFSGNQFSSGNVPAGYNYLQNANLYGTNLNSQVNKDQFGNVIPQQNQQNPGNTMGMNNVQQQQLQQQQLQQQLQQQQSQQTQLYGAGGQSGMNPHLRNTQLADNSGYLVPQQPGNPSAQSPANAQVGYQANPNQLLNDKNLYNPATNTNINNQYGYNANLNPNNNPYGGQMSPNNNNNPWTNNQYSSNTGDTWMPNRDMSSNNNNNNNAAVNNPNSPYFYTNNGHHLMLSCFILLCSFLVLSFFRM